MTNGSVATEYLMLKFILALPESLRMKIFKETPICVRGSALDQHTRTAFAALELRKRPSLDDLGREFGPDAARSGYRHFYHIGAYGGRKAKVDVADTTVPGAAGDLKARLYVPRQKTSDGVLLYIHGGGFTIGDIDTYDLFNRYVCEKIGAKLLFFEYRLAPEHPFPVPVDDVVATAKALPELADRLDFDPNKVTIGGDSAGGMLTVVASHEAVVAGVAIDSLWPLFPVLDYSRKYPSEDDYGIGFGLTKELMDWFTNCFLQNDENRSDPMISPIFLPHLDKLPATLLRIAEYDPLSDQSRAFAEKVKPLGIDLDVRTAKGLAHGYTNMFSIIPAARKALDEDLMWVKDRLDSV